MRRSLWISMVVLSLMCPAVALGQSAYLDRNGDGLPDDTIAFSALNADVSFRVFIDSGAFQWSNYQAWIDRGTNLTFVSGSYVVSGGTNFPIDNFSNPYATGLTGFGFNPNKSGLQLIGSLTLHTNTGSAWCASMIVDEYNGYGTFTSCGLGSAFLLFSSAPPDSTCWSVTGGTSTQGATWGQVKGLFR